VPPLPSEASRNASLDAPAMTSVSVMLPSVTVTVLPLTVGVAVPE
jgi:hypothetical protein